MPMKALTGLVSVWYIPTSEDNVQPEDAASSFHCFPLTQPQILEVQNLYDNDAKRLKPQAYAMAFRLGCRNWKNVQDREGLNLPWSPGAMDTIPAKEIAEIGNHILDISNLTGEDEKNL